MALAVAANASNVAHPRHGFSGGLGMIGTPRAGTRTAELHQAFATWLQSGQTVTPTLMNSRIDERLAWQRPKAIICSALLVVFELLSARIRRTLIRRSRARQTGWRPKDVALLATGVVAGPVCLLLTLMVIGNTQATFALLSMTLFYGRGASSPPAVPSSTIVDRALWVLENRARHDEAWLSTSGAVRGSALDDRQPV